MSLLAGKLGIVFGVANKRSIAWAIAQAWHGAGAKLAFTYQGERLKENVEELAGTFGSDTLILPCDVTKDDEIAGVFQAVSEKFGKLHLLLHSVAFAPKDALEGEFVNTSREAFRIAHDVSAYSLVALARAATPLMTEGGSIIGMSYYGAEKVVPHYNVMGVAKAALEASTRYLAYDLGPKKIRVNCISAGPMNTLAARGIGGFTEMLKHYAAHAPLKRNVMPEELGATGLFLASDGAAAITGQVLYVDCGYQIMGMWSGENKIDKGAASLNVEYMTAKLLTTICVLAIGLGSATSSVAGENGGPMEAAADALVVRPACLVATVVGSAVFIVALPFAAASKSIKKTADALVVKPANATFTRPLGDMDALKEY